jgi:uncharacterized protein
MVKIDIFHKAADELERRIRLQTFPIGIKFMERDKMISSRILQATFAALAGAILVLSFPGLGEAKDPSWPTKMNLVTGPVGGMAFTSMSPWSAEMSNRLGVSISPEATGGHSVNLRMINAGQADLGVTTTDMALEGWEGKEKWTGNVKLQNNRGMFILDPLAYQMYALKRSNINSIQDVKGKIINLSRAGTAVDVWMRRILDDLGIKPARITNLSPSDANSSMADGLLHVSSVGGSQPHPAPAELEVTNEIKIIDWGKDLVEKISQKYPALGVMVIPAKTYKNQTEPVYALGSFQFVFVSKSLPDSLVYEATKQAFEAKARLMGANFAFKYLDPQNITYATTPLHTGAAKYYEEVGVKIPAKITPVR